MLPLGQRAATLGCPSGQEQSTSFPRQRLARPQGPRPPRAQTVAAVHKGLFKPLSSTDVETSAPLRTGLYH